MRKQPPTSTRRHSQQFDISRKPINHPNSQQFVNWTEVRLADDDELYEKKLSFQTKPLFTFRIWYTKISHVFVENLMHP